MGRNVPPLGFVSQLLKLTSNSAAAFRQQMDDSNHEIVGVLAQLISSVFNPLSQIDTETINRVHR